MNEEELYIAIPNPRDLRKRLLESSKVLIYDMREYKNLQVIRKQKIGLIENLKDQIKETVLLIEKLTVLMPEKKINIPEELNNVFSNHSPELLDETHEGKAEKILKRAISEDKLKLAAEEKIKEEEKVIEKEEVEAVEEVKQEEDKTKTKLNTELSNINKLESALDEIEKKLNSLNN